jgi:hypothetical protein
MSGLRERHGLLSEQTLFPGLAVLGLAVAGLFSSVYPRRLRVGLGTGVVVCAILSIGLRDVSGPGRYLTPYRFLYDFAPGWDGVRTPGRITTFTSLGLALLAAAGVCLVVAKLRQRVGARSLLPAAVAAIFVVAILAEGFGPMPLGRAPASPRALLESAPPLLELPIDFDSAARYAYWSVGDFPPLVNGTGAFEPTRLTELRTSVERFPDEASVERLRQLGVRTVVLHPRLARGTPWQDSARRPVDGLPLTRTPNGSTVVYRLAPSRN